MRQAILVLNTGSSSIKFALYSTTKTKLDEKAVLRGQIESLDEQPHFLVKDAAGQILTQQTLTKTKQENIQTFALAYLLDWLKQNLQAYEIIATGHRVVHGANKYSKPQVLTATIIKELEAFNSLAPLHQPYNLAGIRALHAQLPDILHVACFDTAFHHTQSVVAQAFALPEGIAKYPIKRYGFHGLSYEYIARNLTNYLNKEQVNSRIIVAHLGHGASLCALQNRCSVATTMGFTALDGLPMGTRCGSLDPGVILYLLMQEKMPAEKINQLLYEQAGLFGVSGISADMRVLLKSKGPRAKLAVELFVYRIVREIGSLLAALNGLDVLVFTAGIGEHTPEVRAAVCQQLTWLGIELDQQANAKNQSKITTDKSKISVWVIPTNEELMIAQHVWLCWK